MLHQLINYLATEAKPATNMADAEFIVLVWQGLMSNMTAMTEEKTEQQVKEIVLNWIKVRLFHEHAPTSMPIAMLTWIVLHYTTDYRWSSRRVHKRC